MTIFATALLAVLIAAEPPRPFTSPKPTVPEYGYGLAEQDAQVGWISLFDGQSGFGWKDAEVKDGLLLQGETTARFAEMEVKADVISPGELIVGGQAVSLKSGPFQTTLRNPQPAALQLAKGLALKTLAVRPLGLKAVFNGKDLTGWKVIRHSQLPENRQAAWSVESGAICGVGGPGAVELEGLYGDLLLQLEVRTRKPLVNGGVFFRSVPGDFLNGYEAQVFNACYDEDPGQPARYSTGAIDDRQLARRVVSRDAEPFTMTIVAIGPHIATWVNGYPMIDWTDTREQHDNPRQGLRLKKGAIQLQAHDPQSDVEFRNLRIAAIE